MTSKNGTGSGVGNRKDSPSTSKMKQAKVVTDSDNTASRAIVPGLGIIRDEGITVLNEALRSEAGNQKSRAVEFDCVLLHGLNGNPRKTWISKDEKFYWPADLLRTVPTARVMVYGYNASNEWTMGANSITIDNLARRFVLDLCGYRREAPTRPLVLIAHSLGGLIIKQALSHITRDWNAGIRRTNIGVEYGIYTSIIGLMFFGTPHLGSGTGQETRVKVLKAMAGAAFYKPPSNLVKALASRSEESKSISEAFASTTLYVEHTIDVYSFHETRKQWYLGHLVVDSTSAKTGYVGESSIPIARTHKGMIRFDGPHDSTYEMVSQILAIMGETKVVQGNPGKHANNSAKYGDFGGLPKRLEETNEVSSPSDRHLTPFSTNLVRPLSQYKSSTDREPGADTEAQITLKKINQEMLLVNLLTWYGVAQIEQLIQKTPTPQEGTLEWIKTHVGIKALGTGSESHVLHIKGKPGCGKTVLAAVLYRELPRYIGTHVVERIKCFFSFSGRDYTRRTAYQMLTSLVRQLCAQCSVISEDIYQRWESESYSWLAIRHSDTQYDDQGTTEASSKFSLDGIVNFFYALDECEDGTERQILIERFKELVKDGYRNSFDLVVTSRSYWDIDFDFGAQQPWANKRAFTIDLDHSEEVQHDLRAFTNTSVRDLVQKRKNYSSYEEQLKTKLFERANNGMFLMVNLLVDILYNLVDSSPRGIERALSTLPATLQEVYTEIWQRVTLNNEQRARQLMTWLVTVFRPLSLEELNDALAEEDSMGQASDETSTYSAAECLSVDIKGDLERLLGPLIRITNDGESQHVELVHQTVKEFFLPLSAPNTTNPPKINPNRHIHLALVCISALVPTLRTLNPATDYRAISVDLSDVTILGAGAGASLRPFWKYAAGFARHHRLGAISANEDQDLIAQLDTMFERTVGRARSGLEI